MDKSVKIILGIAIAIMYPILVWFAVYTFIPNQRTKPTTQYPAYPKKSSQCLNEIKDRQVWNYKTNQYETSGTYTYKDCSKVEAQYQKELREYSEQKSVYDKEQKDYKEQEAQAVVWRAQLAIVLSVIGLLAVVAAVSISALAGGLAVGSTFTVFVAISFLAPTIFDHGANKSVSVILLLVSFVLLVAELWFVDNKLSLKNDDNFTKEHEPGSISGDNRNIPPANLIKPDSSNDTSKSST